MISLYTQKEFDRSKSIDLLLLKCEWCNKPFTRMKKDVKRSLLGTRPEIRCCSKSCSASLQSPKQKINCVNCNAEVYKRPSQIKKSKSGNNFCSKSCATSYNNKNKKHGTRRSKLEIWLEGQLKLSYPKLDIRFNESTTIGSELDIYIPSLNIAFELNGIFHYEPIYGKDKFNQIQVNDISKSKACHDNKIDLCIINTSGQKYFKPKTSQKYLNIINSVITERLLTS